MNYKVIGTDRREYGPITPDQVRQWIQEHRLHAMSLAQAEGTNEWKPLSMFLEFQAALALVAPPSAPAPLAVAPYVQQRTNSMAVLSLLSGVCAVALCACCYGFPFNILGVVFSLIALSQINRNPQMEQGKGMAIAGLVLSILATVWIFALTAVAALASVFAHRPRLWRM